MLNTSTDEEFSQCLMEGDCFELLEKIGYCGVPTREKLSNRINMIKYDLKIFECQ